MATAQLPPVQTAPGMFGNETVCYPATMVTTNGIWVNENPFVYSLPLFMLQLLLIITTTRLLMFILKPFHVSRVFCELICGIILGPSALGNSKDFAEIFFPRRSLVLLETMANIGVIYFAFIVGLDMDLSILKKQGKKATIFSIAGMFLPFLIGCSFSLFLWKFTYTKENTFVLLFATSLSITALPALARTLGEFRLLGMEIGELAKSSALINEIFGVGFMVLAISLAEKPQSPTSTSSLIMLSSIFFILFSILIVRPAITWLIRRKPEGEGFNDLTTSVMIAGVMISSVITDAIGVHPMFGAFVFGLVVPHGVLSVTLIEGLEDFVTCFLLPLFFVTSGMKTNIAKIQGVGPWITLLAAIILGTAGKVAGTVLAAQFLKMPFSEGFALGLLMNTKGLFFLLGLNIGKDQKVIDDTAYAMMTIVAILTNAIITPTLVRIYKPARKFVPYKRRTVQRTKADSELRILTCIHNPRNVPTIINLLEASHPTKKSPIAVFSLHLVELSGHGSSAVVNHSNRKSEKPAAMSKVQGHSDNIINAFETFERNAIAVTAQMLSAVAPYAIMHEQISDLAEEKRVSFIMMPFHKQLTVDGGMESANDKLRMVNQNVMANAPCSVGILIDRGLQGSTRSAPTPTQISSHNIAVLFFGGADDREALSFALRLSEHPKNTLNVIRFVPGPNAADPEMEHNQDLREFGMLALQIDKERDKLLDDEYIRELKLMKLNEESFSYFEKEVNNGDETVAGIRSLDDIHDLFIVGRSEGMVSSLTAGLTEWSECPELGVIGDLLASADFAATMSVLVVQQYTGMVSNLDGSRTSDTSSHQEEQYIMHNIR